MPFSNKQPDTDAHSNDRVFAQPTRFSMQNRETKTKKAKGFSDRSKLSRDSTPSHIQIQQNEHMNLDKCTAQDSFSWAAQHILEGINALRGKLCSLMSFSLLFVADAEPQDMAFLENLEQHGLVDTLDILLFVLVSDLESPLEVLSENVWFYFSC